MNSSTNKRYTPTTTARPTWREREAAKERQQRESARMAVEEAQRKKIAKTEENFPTMIQTPDQMRVFSGPSGRFVELVSKMQTDEAATRAKQRARKVAHDSAVLFIRSGTRRQDEYEEDYDYEDATVASQEEDLNEKFPPHGKRGTYTEPDNEGWRLVTKKTRKAPRELTEAELVRKYRETFFGEGDESEDADLNGDLTERNQRREFY